MCEPFWDCEKPSCLDLLKNLLLLLIKGSIIYLPYEMDNDKTMSYNTKEKEIICQIVLQGVRS